MKYAILSALVSLFITFVSCSNVSPDAVELKVDFTWEGMKPCGWGNPEIRVSGVPENTKFLKVHMYDHVYFHDHGTVVAPYTGDGIIARDRFEEIQCPCPPDVPGRYKITVKALDASDVVIGIGRKKKYFPEKK